MPNFDKSAVVKGPEAIREANEQRQAQQDGNFKPFLPNIYWADDQDERFVLILNPISEITRMLFHPYIELDDSFPHQILARTDTCIGEAHDPIEDDWQYKPRLTNLMIAVELEATFKTVHGRERPSGFEVKTRTFERRVRDDDGELTDEREEVTVPQVGLIAQSPYNFGNQLESYDASEGPIHQTALKIKRLGKKDVAYNVVGYEADIDLSNLFDYIEFVSFIPNPDELLEQIEGLEPFEATQVIGNYLLDLQIDQFADPDEYESIYNRITKPSRYGNKKGKGKKERAAKPSQRRSRREEPEEEQEEAPRSRRREPEEEVTKAAPAQERLRKLRSNAKVAA